jgi:predicted nucleic acid-binding Zn ribbon protein
MSVLTEATITCPACGAAAREVMPENACRYLYVCKACGERLRPKPGDCCVFCSYSDAVCPPRQTLQRT